MPSNPPRYRVALAVVALLVAAVAPWVGTAGASAAPSASFGERVVYADRGDVVNVTVDTSEAGTVNLGSPEQGFWMQVDVSSGTTELSLNTYEAGMATSQAEMAAAVRGGTVVNAAPTPISEPLETAQYQMNVTINGVKRANAGFVLEERTTNGVEARIAPRSTDVGELSPDEVTDATTPIPDNGTVARGDWFVLHVDATGLNGVLPDEVFDDDTGVNVSFAQSGRQMNVDTNEFGGDSAERLVGDPDREGFYLFVDTAEHGIAAGDRYNVTFSVAADGPLADEREAVSTEVRVVERRVDLRYEGDRLVVENETTIRANTTLAPDTTVNITASDDDLPPFHEPRTKSVGSDRAFAATFDFGDFEPGREFEVRLRDQGQTHDAVVGPVATETPEPTTTETTVEPNTTAETPEPTTTTTETTTTETTEVGLTQVSGDGASDPLTQRAVVTGSSGVGDVPGFDAASLAVALLAAALLAVRRA